MVKTVPYRAPWSNAMSDAERERNRNCQKNHRQHWAVTWRKCNHSAFNGYHRTASDYSEIVCGAPGCGRRWRTSAQYADQLPDAPRRTR